MWPKFKFMVVIIRPIVSIIVFVFPPTDAAKITKQSRDKTEVVDVMLFVNAKMAGADACIYYGLMVHNNVRSYSV